MATRGIVLAVMTLLTVLAVAAPHIFAADREVVVNLGSLRDAHITINQGDHVTWRNASGEKAHLAFAKGSGAPQVWIEGTVTVTFEKPGNYEYYVHQPQARILHGMVMVK